MAIDAKHATLFAQFVVQNGDHGVLRLSRLHVSFNPDLSGRRVTRQTKSIRVITIAYCSVRFGGIR
jgi:hypothetical protein